MKTLLLSLILWLLTTATRAQVAEDLYNTGKAKFDSGYVEEAIVDYSKAIFFKPDYWEAHRWRGHAYFYLDKYQTAIRDYTRVIELNPVHYKSYFDRGKCRYYLEEYPQAIHDYRAGLAVYNKEGAPADTVMPKVYYSYALIFEEVAEADKPQLRNADLTTEVFSTEAVANLADSTIRNLLYDTAIAYLNAAIALEPKQKAHRLVLGNIYYKKDDSDAALSQYAKAVESNDGQPFFDASYNSGIVYNEKDMAAEARDNLLVAHELRPDHAETMYLLAKVYAKLNMPQLVEHWLNEGAEWRPVLANDYYQIGTGFGKVGGNLDMAAVYIKKAIELDPTVELYYEDLAVAYGLNGKFNEAIKASEDLIKVNPNYAVAYNNLSISYRNKGNKKMADKYKKIYEEMKSK